jgi:hypothetical protein
MKNILIVLGLAVIVLVAFVFFGASQPQGPTITMNGHTYSLGQDPSIHDAFGVLNFVVDRNASGTYILDFGTSSVIANNQPLFNLGLILQGQITSASNTLNELTFNTFTNGGWVAPYLIPVPQLPTSSGTYGWEVDLQTVTTTYVATGTITK